MSNFKTLIEQILNEAKTKGSSHEFSTPSELHELIAQHGSSAKIITVHDPVGNKMAEYKNAGKGRFNPTFNAVHEHVPVHLDSRLFHAAGNKGLPEGHKDFVANDIHAILSHKDGDAHYANVDSYEHNNRRNKKEFYHGVDDDHINHKITFK